MAAEVTETAIKSAVWKRASYIMENLDSMTLKSCRRGPWEAVWVSHTAGSRLLLLPLSLPAGGGQLVAALL